MDKVATSKSKATIRLIASGDFSGGLSCKATQFDDVGLGSDRARKECSVVGIFNYPNASRLCYLALHVLQHRGLEGAGIMTVHANLLKTNLKKLARYENVQLGIYFPTKKTTRSVVLRESERGEERIVGGEEEEEEQPLRCEEGGFGHPTTRSKSLSILCCFHCRCHYTASHRSLDLQTVTGLLIAEVNVNTMRELGSGGVLLEISQWPPTTIIMINSKAHTIMVEACDFCGESFHPTYACPYHPRYRNHHSSSYASPQPDFCMSRPSPRSPQQKRRTIEDMEKDMISDWLSPSTKKYPFDDWSNSSYQQDTYSSMRNQPSRDIIRFLLETEQDINLTEQELDQWFEQRDQEAEEEIKSILRKYH
ncbi:hypothetical protein Sjap_019792 [Stephania japonica]|uniref:Glutamine amidotransferase type-2 domain-containing protein n=1 Tax=Stephania japonica TaxID=461633 RepID=A0AAP0HV21_9MAGN